MSATGTRVATYTDGTPVQEGDRIRYKQAPGGMLPPSKEWDYGTAAKYPHKNPDQLQWLDPDELHLLRDGRYFYLVGHIVERAS